MAANTFFTRLLENGEFRVTDEGIITLYGEPTSFIPIRTLVHLQRMLENQLGQNEAYRLLKEAGRGQTQRALNRYRDRYNLDDIPRDEIGEMLHNVARTIGIGTIDIKQPDRKDIHMAAVNRSNPVAQVYRSEHGETDYCVDYFIEGLVENGLGPLIDEDTEAVEERCMAKGDDACVFLLKATS